MSDVYFLLFAFLYFQNFNNKDDYFANQKNSCHLHNKLCQCAFYNKNYFSKSKISLTGDGNDLTIKFFIILQLNVSQHPISEYFIAMC